MKRFLVTLLAAVVVSMAALPAGAKPPPDKPGGGPGDPDPPPPGSVYVAATLGSLYEVATDGLTATPLPCLSYGDLTHGPVGGERYFIWSEAVPDSHPSGHPAAELFAVAYSEAADAQCSPIQLTDFFSQPSVVEPGIPRWSPDGSQVAFSAFDWAKRDACPPETPAPECPEPYEIWIADFDATGPALTNPRVLAPEFGASSPLKWSHDGAYLATSKARDDSSTGIFVIDTASGAVFDVSPDLSTYQIHPTFSPVADRIAYLGPTPRGDSLRREIYVADFVVDPQTQVPALQAVTQITDKKNMKSLELRFPDWSIDGEHITFTGADGGWTTPTRRLYRIAATGSDKAVLLSAFDDTASFGMPLWRQTPSANP